MPKLLLRGAFIRFVDLRYDAKSKIPYVKINFSASFSDRVREAMEWGEPPAGYGSSDLDGEFAATHLVLTPNGLKGNEISMDAKSIGTFSLERVKGDDGESTHHELRFQVVTAAANAGKDLQDYLAVVGKGVAVLRVNYEAQSELEMQAEEGSDTGGDEAEEPEQELLEGHERTGRGRRRAPELVTN